MGKFDLRNLLMAAAMIVASSFTGCNTEEVDYDTPYLKLSESSKTFDHSQSSYEFAVESNRPWKVTTEQDAQGVVPDWLRVQPDHGDGNGKFTVTVLSLEGIERMATLRVSTATVWEALRITQTGTIATTDLFYMSFGTAATSQPWPEPSGYTDWGASGEGVTDATSYSGDCTLRGKSNSDGYSDASGGVNAYLGWDKYFQINNISVVGGNQMNITFGCAYYDGSSDNVYKSEYITVEASTDGGSSWLPVTYTSAPTTSDRWYFSTGSVVLPVGATEFDLRFKGALSSGQLRIDDVTIVSQEAETPTEPQVMTGQASDVTSTTATLNGTYNFGTPATELGFEWKPSSAGDEAYQKVQGVGSVAFTAAISGLSATTSYDYKAYAIVEGQTYYGEVKSFTSDAAGAVLLKESMGTEGGSSSTYVDSYDGWLKEGLGATSVTYTGIASNKVTVRATSAGASKDYEGASGGNYVYFGNTQPNSFFVNNITVGGASNFTLSFGCNEYSSSQDNIVTAAELQVFYSTTGADDSYTQLTVPYAEVKDTWQFVSVSFTTPAPAQNLWLKFTSNVNSAISIDDITLRTTDNVNIEPAPKVTTTAPATSVGDNTATVGGSYTYTGSQTISKVGVAYKTASDPDFTEVDAASVTSPFTVDLTGLTLGTMYNYKAYVKIGSDTYYGNEETFTTTGTAVAKSIKELKALMTGTEDYTVAENITITGTVVSNYQTANMDYKSIVLQDSLEPGSGFTVRWPGSSGHEFAYGAELTVSAQGGTLSYYSGVLQLTPTATDKITATGKTNTPQPVSITVEQLNTNQYQGMYVAVPNSQVVTEDLSKTMCENSSWGNIQMETSGSGSGTYVMATKGGNYGATFKDESVPQLNGTLMGVAYINNTTVQVMPQALSDFQGWTDSRFGDPVGISFGDASFTATKGVANEALEGAFIEIPYTLASGSETYPNVVVTVMGAGIGTIPTSIPYNVSSVTAGAGTIRIPVTGTPAEGEVNFSVAGIDSDVITCSKTFVAAGAPGLTSLYYESFGNNDNSTASIDSYSGWLKEGQPNASYVVSTKKINLRKTNPSIGYDLVSGGSASGNFCAFFGTGVPNTLTVSGINIEGATNVKLYFGVCNVGNQTPKDWEEGEFTVEVSTNGGGSWTPVTFSLVNAASGAWKYATSTSEITSSSNFAIRFTATVASTYRLDDVQIMGVK